MRKIHWQLIGAAMLTLGLWSLEMAIFGDLWQPGYVEYLGYLQLYVLHPALYLFGGIAAMQGVWLLWMRWTTFGYVWHSWRDACAHERWMDEQLMPQCENPDGWPRATWRSDLEHGGYLLTRCAVGRHDATACWYSNGGEDGPRGTYCGDCGLRVSNANATMRSYPPKHDDFQRVWGDGPFSDPLGHLEPPIDYDDPYQRRQH